MKNKVRTGLNLLMAVIIIIEWGRLCFSITGESFMSGGLRTLKYFTVLSNLLEAAACILFVWKGNELIKYAAAVSVGVTFTVVMIFLGPVFGYAMMFSGPSLWFHGLIPLMAMAEFVVFNESEMSARDNMKACVPLLIYGIGYIGNILMNGVLSNDWYGFMRWGYFIGSIVFLIILAIAYLIGLLLRKLNMKATSGK